MTGNLGAPEMAQAIEAGGGKNPNIIFVHNECYAGEHATQIADYLDKKGFTQQQRPDQFYARPPTCNGRPINGEQIGDGNGSILTQRFQPGPDGRLTLDEMNDAAQGMSVPGYITHIKRVVGDSQHAHE
jgi:hypothetical protein